MARSTELGITVLILLLTVAGWTAAFEGQSHVSWGLHVHAWKSGRAHQSTLVTGGLCPLGLELDRVRFIDNAAMTASDSETNPSGLPALGRLHNTAFVTCFSASVPLALVRDGFQFTCVSFCRGAGAWIAKHNQDGQYLQIDFTTPTEISAIATQVRHLEHGQSCFSNLLWSAFLPPTSGTK